MGPFFIHVIVPFSRPLMAGNVLANYHRQSYRNKKLIIVINGKAKHSHIDCDVLLASNDSAVDAKNVGINWLKENGGGYFSIFDDDDYYGPEYLDEVAYYRNRATVIGKNIHYFCCEKGMFLANTGYEHKYVKRVHGPTISCHSSDAPLYTEGLNEENRFCQNVIKNHGTVYNTSISNYIYKRGLDNTWKISDDDLIKELNAKKVNNGRNT